MSTDSLELSEGEKLVLKGFMEGLNGHTHSQYSAKTIGNLLQYLDWIRTKTTDVPTYNMYIDLLSQVTEQQKRVDAFLAANSVGDLSEMETFRLQLANIERQLAALNPDQGKFS